MTAKEMRRSLRDPVGLMLWLLIPLSILTLMSLVFGGRAADGPRPQALILMADEDGTLVSGMVGGAFGQGPLAQMFRAEKTSVEAGRARMAKGEAAALVMVPKGFQERVLRNEKCVLKVVKNPAQRMMPAIAAETLAMLAEGVHYAHLIGGDELKRAVSSQKEPTEAQVLATSAGIYRVAKEASRWLFPPVLEVEYPPAAAKAQAAFNPVPFLFPGMVFMSLLFLARGLSDDVWEELRNGTYRRSLAAGAGAGQMILAKLLAALAVAAPVALLALGAGRWFSGVGVANWVAALTWMCLGAAVWYLILFEVQMLAGAEHRGSILTSAVVFPSMMMGGAMFGFAMMPEAIARIGKATPLGWMVFRFDLILQGKASAAQVWAWMGWMGLAGVVLFGVAMLHLRRKFLQG